MHNTTKKTRPQYFRNPTEMLSQPKVLFFSIEGLYNLLLLKKMNSCGCVWPQICITCCVLCDASFLVCYYKAMCFFDCNLFVSPFRKSRVSSYCCPKVESHRNARVLSTFSILLNNLHFLRIKCTAEDIYFVIYFCFTFHVKPIVISTSVLQNRWPLLQASLYHIS